MTRQQVRGAVILLSLTLTLAGCGSRGWNSTDVISVTESSTAELGPRGSDCAVELDSIGGVVKASVEPASLYLELRRGTCSSPGTLAAASPTGRLAQTVRAGAYHVSVVNPSDSAVRYSLTVEYTTVSP